MKTTIQKRFGDLEPGDVLTGFGAQALVVFFVRKNAPCACRDVFCMGAGLPNLRRELTLGSGEMVAVEVERIVEERAELTPAQQHADDLLSLARFAKAASFCTPKFREAIEIVLDKIDPPQAPTLDEALGMLRDIREVINPPGLGVTTGQMLDSLLDRARRSGVFK